MTNTSLRAGLSSGIPCAEADIQADASFPIKTRTQSPDCSATSNIVPGAAETCLTCLDTDRRVEQWAHRKIENPKIGCKVFHKSHRAEPSFMMYMFQGR